MSYYKKKILRDNEKQILIDVFGDILYCEDKYHISIEGLISLLKSPILKPRYKISILFPDESVNYEIPLEDIPEDGISYSENYEQGQRRNITLKLINVDGKYTPSINGLWLDSKFKFDMGLELPDGLIIYFTKGIYEMGNVDLSDADSKKEVSIQLKDKFSILEGKKGTLEESLEIPENTLIEEVVKQTLSISSENGYMLDYKEPILHFSYKGFKTQSTIRIEAGSNYGELILQLATQMSAECYYNNIGNLCFIPINDSINDIDKPVIWTFDENENIIGNFNLKYSLDDVINVVKIVGDNVDKGIFSAVVKNENISSPICIQRVGKRVLQPISSPNVWSDELAEQLGKYEIRKKSIVNVSKNTSVNYNPILIVNNLCEIDNSFYSFKRQKFLIKSISHTSKEGVMNVELSNVNDLPFV
jgi:hypothetical protein